MRSAEERITVKDGLSHLKSPFFKPKQTIKVPNVTCVWWMWKGWRTLEKPAMEASFSMMMWPPLTLVRANDASQRLHEVAAWATSKGEWYRRRVCVCVCVTKSTRGAFKRALLQAVFHDCCRLWVLSYRLMWGNIRPNGVKDIGDVGISQKMQHSEGRGRILITKQEIPGRCLGS